MRFSFINDYAVRTASSIRDGTDDQALTECTLVIEGHAANIFLRSHSLRPTLTQAL
jgi:hypothetical protein